MDLRFWTAVVVMAVMVLVSLGPGFVSWALGRTADRVGLGAPAELRPLLLRRTRATHIGAGVGAIAGLLAAGLIGSVVPASPTRVLVENGTLLESIAGGLAIGGITTSRGLSSPGRRVARDRAVLVGDYIGPVERTGVAVAALLAAVVGLLPAVIGPAGPHPLQTAAAAAAVVAWAAFEAAAHRIVARPQTADTAARLAWDDALRADAIRSLAGAAGAVAIFALLGAVWSEASALLPRSAAETVSIAVLLGVLAVLVPIRLWLAAQAPGRWLLGRLSPDAVPVQPEWIAS